MQAEEMQAKLIKGLEEKYGKPLEHWVKLARSSGLEKHKQVLNFMKENHGFSYGHANLVAFKALKTDVASIGSSEDVLNAMFKGKEHWRELYEAILKAFGNPAGLEISPKKSYVSLRHKKQFAILQPSTKTRFDVGLKFSQIEAEQGVEESGKWNSMVSHRVKLTDINQVDDELIGLLKEAFNQAG